MIVFLSPFQPGDKTDNRRHCDRKIERDKRAAPTFGGPSAEADDFKARGTGDADRP
jgi:hypothetical protein